MHALNGLQDTVHFRCSRMSLMNCQSLLQAGEQYDVVILDPPAFTKSRNSDQKCHQRLSGDQYPKGLKLVKDGGYLATCSCSHYHDIMRAVSKNHLPRQLKVPHKRLRQVEFQNTGPRSSDSVGSG